MNATPFDAIAQDYERLWNTSEKGRRQRLEVWAELDTLFAGVSTLLDLGCGTGDDAAHFESRGVRCVAIDSSAAMIDLARRRGVNARQLDIRGLNSLEGPFDGALSNFGALNCVRELDPVARELGRLVRSGGPLALCLMSRVHVAETVEAVRAGDFRKAVRRWSGHAEWRGIDVFYPSAIGLRRSFRPWFAPVRSVRIGGGDHTLFIFERRQHVIR